MFSKIMLVIRKNLKRSFDEKSDITITDLQKLQKEGAIIIDVRSPQEFKEEHINGAICIPEYEIKKKSKELLKDKNENIVVYCSSGSRSKKAQKQLERLGYINVYNLYNGLEEWYNYNSSLQYNDFRS